VTLTPEELKKELLREKNIEDTQLSERVVANLLLQYPGLLRFPGFVEDIFSYARDHQGTVSPIWFLDEAKKRGINLLGGGGGGRSAEDKANSIRSFSAAIINAAGQFGIEMTPELVAYIAEVADDQNFSMDQLNDVILNEANWDALKPGTLTVNVDRIKQVANQYLIDTSTETLRNYSVKIASGQSSLEAVESMLKAQARIANPWMAEYIDQGISPVDLLASAQDRIAKSLGISASEVNFMDDRFMKMATVTDEKGTTRLATNTELTKQIRADDAWASTEEASQVTSALASSLAQIFGRSAF